ncbi:unnamed protein product [Adineta steineri]|uniref:SMP-30/Gluconolactonase/LRE-like region domain-containing protein n=1 Tax=Adineta steineri TaxID=433720 RepID=A0A818RU61_9BILA|nr:unnamed protein product [Adineta steineri]CAF1158577.1 unnamed protein product [Adineta steineri]CAF3663269.1 unnamed protein product [Adineta steineri]CAF3726160.1 unnamed protein product [Adineta steineri]
MTTITATTTTTTATATITATTAVTITAISTTVLTTINMSTTTTITIRGSSNSSTNITANSKWIQNGITVAGGNERGDELYQLGFPESIYIDDDDRRIYITDYKNHRIVEWEYSSKSSRVVAGGNREGNRSDQLSLPRDAIVDKQNDSLIICDRGNKRIVRWLRRNGTNGQTIISNIACNSLTMDNNGDLYVSDFVKDEIRRWKIGDTNGIIVAGGNGQGNHLNQLNGSTYIFVDEDHSIYISDTQNHRIVKWTKNAKDGIVIAGGHGPGKNLTQLNHPSGLLVDQSGSVYVSDCYNQRIMRWLNGSKEGSIVVGGNGQGAQSNKFAFPRDLSFDQEHNLFVVDQFNDRVQKFLIDPD